MNTAAATLYDNMFFIVFFLWYIAAERFRARRERQILSEINMNIYELEQEVEKVKKENLDLRAECSQYSKCVNRHIRHFEENITQKIEQNNIPIFYSRRKNCDTPRVQCQVC